MQAMQGSTTQTWRVVAGYLPGFSYGVPAVVFGMVFQTIRLSTTEMNQIPAAARIRVSME